MITDAERRAARVTAVLLDGTPYRAFAEEFRKLRGAIPSNAIYERLLELHKEVVESMSSWSYLPADILGYARFLGLQGFPQPAWVTTTDSTNAPPVDASTTILITN